MEPSFYIDDQPGYSWKLGPSHFRALPGTGARLMSWSLATAVGQRDILYWPDTYDQQSTIGRIRGGNPILFPFCGRTYHNGKKGFWAGPNKNILPMEQHGFARDGRFELESLSPEGFVARLLPTEADSEAYPFSYSFRVEYSFQELGLNVKLRLQNLDNQQIPWAAGHHFYFTIPWHKGLSHSAYQVEIDARKAAYHTPEGPLTKAPLEGKIHNLGDPAVCDRIHFQLRNPLVTINPRSGEEPIFIEVEPDQSMPAKYTSVVTWTESPTSLFYCVEPWMAPPNSPDHGKGIHWVAPETEAVFSVNIKLG